MRMFNKEELEKIKEQYYKIYQPFFETEYFSVLYDNSEKEWCYVIDEDITKEQLADALQKFSVEIANLKIVDKCQILKTFTIEDYIDNNSTMMRDKNLYNLYAKFEFMYPAFYDVAKE